MNKLRPTVLGVKAFLFYSVLVAAFFATPYANLYFLLLAFLTALGAVGLMGTLRALRHVTAEIADPGEIPAGAGWTLRATFDTGGASRYHLIAALDLEGVGRVETSRPFVRGTATAEGSVPALERGVYAVRAATLESTYPLGILRSKRSIDGPDELIVFPDPVASRDARGGGDAISDLADALAHAEGCSQPSGLREYRVGDGLRSVNWHATARRGRPIVTEWEGEAGSGLEVAFDRRCESKKLEEALSLITTLALAAREEKERLTVHSQGLSRTFGSGATPWRDLLRFLARAEALPLDGPAPPPTPPAILRLPVGATA